MNKQLVEFARTTLIKGLLKCTDKQILLFKRMYSHKDLNLSVEEVVRAMPEEKLDWAMKQVSRTSKS